MRQSRALNPRPPHLVIVLLLALLPAVVAGQTSPSLIPVPSRGGSGGWYYQIGGAQGLSRSANPEVTRVTIRGLGRLGLGYSCGKFDPEAAVTNILNQVAAGADAMMDAMVLAAQSAIASLPAYILQRANPGLYDLFQTDLLKAQETLTLAHGKSVLTGFRYRPWSM